MYKALIRSVMTYTCPVWEFAADTHLLKSQSLQNKVRRTVGKFLKCTHWSTIFTWLSKYCIFMIT